MRKLILAALLFAGCAKEQPPRNELKFEAKSDYGSIIVKKDGKEIYSSEVKGVWSQTVPAAPGQYEISFVSVPPGYSYTYIYHNDTLKAGKEQSHTKRVMWVINYTHK